MDLNLDYSDDDNPLSLKVDFILSFYDIVVRGEGRASARGKTIIDRCVRLVFRDYLADPRPENMPTLQDLYDCLRAQDEGGAVSGDGAGDIRHRQSERIQPQEQRGYTTASSATTSRELGKQLRQLRMLVVQDQVWNRVTRNREAGKTTRYYVDEFHLLLRGEPAAWERGDMEALP